MLRPDEIMSLRTSLATATFQGSLSSGIPISKATIQLGNAAASDTLWEEEASTVAFFPPEQIIGKPHDAGCLVGAMTNTDIVFPKKTIRNVQNARIIGWRAIIDDQSRFFAPDPFITAQALRQFIKTSRAEFDGFLTEDIDDVFSVYFAARPTPHLFRGQSVFLPFVEQGNYGSFLCRGLPALLFLHAFHLPFERLVVPERTPWMMESLSLLGFGNIPVFGVREICGDIFENLAMVVSPDKEGTLDEITVQRLSHLSSKAIGGINFGPQLYVSRRLSNLSRPNYRVLDNEHIIEALLKSSGYVSIYPETLTFTNQISTFVAAQRIIGPSGSGMLNSIFSPAGSIVVDMESYHTTVRQHAKLYSCTKKKYNFLFGQLLQSERPMALARWSVGDTEIKEALRVLNS